MNATSIHPPLTSFLRVANATHEQEVNMAPASPNGAPTRYEYARLGIATLSVLALPFILWASARTSR